MHSYREPPPQVKKEIPGLKVLSAAFSISQSLSTPLETIQFFLEPSTGHGINQTSQFLQSQFLGQHGSPLFRRIQDDLNLETPAHEVETGTLLEQTFHQTGQRSHIQFLSIEDQLWEVPGQLSTNIVSRSIRPSGNPGEEIKLDVDPHSHPAWTGGAHRLVDTGGQLAKFNKRFKDFGLKD